MLSNAKTKAKGTQTQQGVTRSNKEQHGVYSGDVRPVLVTEVDVVELEREVVLGVL